MTRAGVACRAALALTLAACSRGPARPGAVDTRSDACASCRMIVSDARFAAQLAAPGEEPRFFDDLGCLRDHLRASPRLPPGSVAFVADHRTGEWIRASQAQFTRSDSLRTPMASHLIAHASQASRDGDPAAAGGRPVPAVELFWPQGPPDGTP